MSDIDYYKRIRDIAPEVDYDRSKIRARYREIYNDELPDTFSIKMILMTIVKPAVSTYVPVDVSVTVSTNEPATVTVIECDDDPTTVTVIECDDDPTTVTVIECDDDPTTVTVIEYDDDIADLIDEKTIADIPKKKPAGKPTYINCKKLNELRPKSGAAGSTTQTSPVKLSDCTAATTKNIADCIVIVLDVETERKVQKFTDETGTDIAFGKVLIEVAYQKYRGGKLIKQTSRIVNVPKLKITGTGIHRITTDIMINEGLPIDHVLDEFVADIADVDVFVGHNVLFDFNVMLAELYAHGRADVAARLKALDVRCTMGMYSQIHGKPRTSLTKVYNELFSTELEPRHIALFDVQVCADIFHKMLNVPMVN